MLASLSDPRRLRRREPGGGVGAHPVGRIASRKVLRARRRPARRWAAAAARCHSAPRRRFASPGDPLASQKSQDAQLLAGLGRRAARVVRPCPWRAWVISWSESPTGHHERRGGSTLGWRGQRASDQDLRDV